jgi:MFS family permease
MKKQIIIIVIAQLFGTSLWFSANSVAENLIHHWGLRFAEIGLLTTAVQVGFVAGTLIFAFSGFADKFAASKIFTICCILGALFNCLFALYSTGLESALLLRFAVGLSMAGIYPIGMKLVVSWNPQIAGQSLGLLVSMLTLGTALPHGIRMMEVTLSWQSVILSSSALALVGALMVAKLGDGPYAKFPSKSTSAVKNILTVCRNAEFRASAFGYFGHMWELYAFWTLVPTLLAEIILPSSAHSRHDISGWTFAVIGIGSLGCIASGAASQKYGQARVAWWALLTSGSICFVYPLLQFLSSSWKLVLMFIWGAAVIADSPQFSAMSAKACPPEMVGTALALQNSFGFLLTIFSILIVTSIYPFIGNKVSWILLPGPIFGLLSMRPLFSKNYATQ